MHLHLQWQVLRVDARKARLTFMRRSHFYYCKKLKSEYP